MIIFETILLQKRFKKMLAKIHLKSCIIIYNVSIFEIKLNKHLREQCIFFKVKVKVIKHIAIYKICLYIIKTSTTLNFLYLYPRRLVTAFSFGTTFMEFIKYLNSTRILIVLIISLAFVPCKENFK